MTAFADDHRGQLGPGWQVAADGIPFRRAARLLLLDDDGRLLLVRGHDVDDPSRSWWFTVGGGIEPGESERDAAARELLEETGLQVDPGALVGPVVTRSATFDFAARLVRQDEVFFVARVSAAVAQTQIVTDGWTGIERDFMDEVRWWPLAELAAVEIEVFPAELHEIASVLVEGWDGAVRHLGHADER